MELTKLGAGLGASQTEIAQLKKMMEDMSAKIDKLCKK
jgi:hypothetical protein